MTGTRAVSFTSWYASTVPLFVSGALELYVTDDVMSIWVYLIIKMIDER